MSLKDFRYANIVICSYLGGSRELQEKRLEFHLRQRAELDSIFKEQKILSICSAYPDWAKNKMKGNLCHFVKDRMLKLEIHNLFLKQFYKGLKEDGLEAVLILGDDVVPVAMEGEGTNEPDLALLHFLNNPEDMPAPCLFFSCKGIFRDSFYKERNKRNPSGFSATGAVTGWAIMIRNDLKVLMEPEEITDGKWQFNDDAMLRYKCAAKGKECLKCERIFFTTFQGTSTDKNSLWYKDRDQRNAGIAATSAAIERLWPWLLLPKIQPKVLRPVWSIKGDQLKSYVRAGLLEKGNYSYIPTKRLKEWWEEMHNRPSLADMAFKKKEKK